MKQKGEKERKEKEEDYSISKPSSGRKVPIIIMSKNPTGLFRFWISKILMNWQEILKNEICIPVPHKRPGILILPIFYECNL